MKKLFFLLTLTGLLTFSTAYAENETTEQATTKQTEITTTKGTDNNNTTTVDAPKPTTENAVNKTETNNESNENKGKNPGGFNWTTIVFWVLLIVVIYFFMIRPASKRRKEAEKFKESLKKGSKVITTSGVYGIIDEINDTFVLLEIANGVKIKIDKNSIVSFTEAEAQAQEKDNKKSDDTTEKK